MDPEGVFLRFDEWSGKVQARLDDHRKSVDAINALMVVAAFIAGVQAQIISFTLQLPQTALGRTTNFFAFLGLILEISGTFLGALHALVLQHKVIDVSNTISYMAQCKANLKIIIKAIQRQHIEPGLAVQVPEPAEESDSTLAGELNSDDLNRGESVKELEEERVPTPAEESDSTRAEESNLDRPETVREPTPEPVEELYSENVLDDMDRRRQAQQPHVDTQISENGLPPLHALYDTLNTTFGLTGEPVKESRPRLRRGFRRDPGVQPLDREEEKQVLNPPENSAPAVISSGVSNMLISGGTFNLFTNAWNSIANTADHQWDVDDLEERAMNVINVLHEMDHYYKDLAPPGLIDIIVEHTEKVLTATERRDPQIARQNNNFSIGRNIPVLRFVVTYGNIPLMSMAGGVACMALSTILFAASSQFLKPEVWIASLVALVGVMGLSFLPICSFMLELFAVRFGKLLPHSSHLPEPVTSKRR